MITIRKITIEARTIDFPMRKNSNSIETMIKRIIESSASKTIAIRTMGTRTIESRTKVFTLEKINNSIENNGKNNVVVIASRSIENGTTRGDGQ